jgi:hypothetical protein
MSSHASEANSQAKQPSRSGNLSLETLLSDPPLLDDDWQLTAELRGVDRLVDRLRRVTAEPAHQSPSAGPHLSLGGVPIPSAMGRLQSSGDALPSPRRQKNNLVAWTLLSLGLATFVCGAVLLGWSFLENRADLWSIGMPLTLAGQAGLLVGLVLQLEGLWQSNRHTEATLTDLDGKLSQLRHATTMLSTTHSSPAQSFYVHMAEGASPQLLLADLKGQIDLLSQQMAVHQRGR